MSGDKGDSGNRRLIAEFKGYFLSALTIITVWSLTSYIVSSPALPQPFEVVIYFLIKLPELSKHVAVSLFRVVYSIILALSISIPLGLMCFKDSADRIISPFIFLLYPIPHIVLLPLIILLFGIGDASKIFLIAMILFFQILVTTRDSARNISEYYILSLKSLGASDWDVYRHVVFPASLPRILTAMRISVGTAIAVLFFAESFATTTGLGYVIMDAWSRADYKSLYAGIISMALLGFSMYIVLEIIEKRLCRWV
ncbi:ABC-type nitrate/sulfonate/bicarbonate transport system, permease component [Archaeoglobus sulfaticallidus PM70-1]|uniref:ABC-type nitrate/sulfonate/bicarbonate transport system, permease component n=1 Tax=Archaeoglobus sulfaticallidus PM70-1 TaxID=387631 RepID=N0BJ38_9EURY|nr:ABC transporter permease [Archaeoglobus sulfaticallidus]AGK60476.1 ABC-type nitrate/sulfonate/bicarbonate transport system, permease component [Archaeoglobus sulfaticallidus PM70-1]